MKVTLLGIITDVSPLQPSNASQLIRVTVYLVFLSSVTVAGIIKSLFVISLYPVTSHS